MKEKIHVIGAGISGLGAAHFLARQAQDVVIHEANEKPGGRAGYTMWEGECLEFGGKNFSSDWQHFNAMASDFNLFEHDQQHPNFHIVMNDRLIGLKKKQTLLNGLALVHAIGITSALEFHQLLKCARKFSTELNYAGGLIEEVARKYDDQPISMQFHRNLAYGPLRMFSIIMGAAEPDETYMSQIMLFLSSFGEGSHHSLRGGIKRFFDALAADKTLNFGSRLERIEVTCGRVKALHFTNGRKNWCEKANHVISTLPLPALLKALDLPGKLREQTNRIRYFPLALINAIYDQDVFDDSINSIMFGPGSILGHCSANRMYQKNRVRFTLSGREARRVLHLEDEALITMAEQEFRRFRPIRGKRIYAHVQRHIGGICAYAPHFTGIKQSLLGHVAGIKGLEIAGDYLEGHSMEGCLNSANLAVKRLTASPTGAGGTV